MLSDLMKEDLIKGLLDIFSGDIEAIILYGSVARNESTPESDIDIAVSLHACDIATDIALIKAAQWGSKLIIAVPCCHHELFNAIENDTLNPILKYGVLKDKFASIVTDAMRGLALQTVGYDVNIMEFTPAENTPKNVLIKAVRTGKGNESAKKQYNDMKKMLNITPYIDRLVKDV